MKRNNHLVRDLIIIAVSITATFSLEYFSILDYAFNTWSKYALTIGFVNGFFFTSLFTITPSIVVFIELSQIAPLWLLAFFGACGAVFGDLVLFLFVRDAVADDIALFINRPWKRWLTHVFRHPFLQWVVPVAGALIIASPLPDELGLAMMGLTKTRISILIPVSFVMNFLGIMLIGIGAQSLQ